MGLKNGCLGGFGWAWEVRFENEPRAKNGPVSHHHPQTHRARAGYRKGEKDATSTVRPKWEGIEGEGNHGGGRLILGAVGASPSREEWGKSNKGLRSTGEKEREAPPSAEVEAPVKIVAASISTVLAWGRQSPSAPTAEEVNAQRETEPSLSYLL